MTFKKSCILISQVWINEDRLLFREMLEIAALKCRALNLNTHIILSGSGLYPTEKTLSVCNKVIWQEDNNEFPGNGFPEMIHKGLVYAWENGYEYIFKFRGDSIIFKNEICKYCLDILIKEDKRLLITQETTANFWLGDMVIFGEIKILKELFNPNFWIKSPFKSGNDILGKRYLEYFKFDNSKDWLNSLRAYCSFRDIPKFKWVDLRYNYEYYKNSVNFYKLTEETQKKYFWGNKQKIHLFDEDEVPQTNKIKWIFDWIYEFRFYNFKNKYMNSYSYIRKYFLINYFIFLTIIRKIYNLFYKNLEVFEFFKKVSSKIKKFINKTNLLKK